MRPPTTPASRALRGARAALAACTLALLAPLAPRVARAADTGADIAVAQTLFEEGRRLMEAKRYAEACPKFAESQRLRPGTGTLLNLALCHESLGKTATAWGQFKEVLFAAKKENNEAREAFAQEHIAALEPRLSRLQIDAESTPGLAIRRDGQEIPAAVLGTPIPVDPGVHEIEATAPGYTVWSTSVTISESAEGKTVAIPKLTPAPVEKAAAPTAPSDGGGSAARRTAGFAVGGVGIAAIGVGAVFGMLAAGQASDAENNAALCPGKRCTPAGRQEIDAAETKALVSTIGIGVGLAAVAGGAILVLTSGSAQPAGGAEGKTAAHARGPAARFVPVVGPGGGGAYVVGAF